MKKTYRVSINYLTFDFDNLSDACTFATLGRESRPKPDTIIDIEFTVAPNEEDIAYEE